MESEKPEQPKKPFGRSLSDFGELKLGERKLLEACRVGEVAKLGDTVPVAATDENSVRANFLRFLLLGGDEQSPIHESGVQLKGAYIVEGPLNLKSCRIPTDVDLKFCYFGHEVNAIGALFNAGLNLDGSYLIKGVQADHSCCARNVSLGNGLKVTAEVKFNGARVGGNFDCRGGQFMVKGGVALSVQGANIEGDVCLSEGFETTGEVVLLDAKIGQSLKCFRGQFKVASGAALSADRVETKGSIFLNNGFKATGMVRLLGAQVGSNLDCKEGYFDGIEDCALDANRINVKGSVFLIKKFKAIGTVNLQGARIGGNLDCSNGHFEMRKGIALGVSRSKISGSVFFNGEFSAIGLVHMLGAQIGGNFNCNGGNFEVPNGFALTIEAAVIRGVWHFYQTPTPVCVNAVHAKVAVLADEVKCWGKGSVLDGFSYASLSGPTKNIGEKRIKWLSCQLKKHLGYKNFRPDPWRQLQRVLRESGCTEDAKLVGIAFEQHMQRIGRVGYSAAGTNCFFAFWKRIISRSLHDGFGVLAGYGYRPIRLLTWMLGVWLACGALYCLFALPQFNAVAPSDPLIFKEQRYSECQPVQDEKIEKPEQVGEKYVWPSCSKLPGEYSTFSPFAYSLDLLLPVVDLGQESAWGAYIPSSTEMMVEKPLWDLRWGYVVRLLGWFETLFGWVSSLLLIAIISGFSRRNDES